MNNNGVNGSVGAGALTPAAAAMVVAQAQNLEPLPPNQLTVRELDVIREVAAGRTDKQIGTALGITAITVRNHLAHIRAKLGFANRTQVAVHYQRLEYLRALAPAIGLTPAEARECELLRAKLR